MSLIRSSIAMALLLAVTASASLAGYSRGGGFSAAGYGVRAWGMGGAAVAYNPDESAAYWNPACLSLLGRSRVGFSYADLIPETDAQQSYIAYGAVLKKGSELEPGLDYNVHSFGAIYYHLHLDLPDDRSYRENTLRLAYAFSPEYFVSIGAAFTALQSSAGYENFGSKGTAIDVGLRLALLKNWTVGAVAHNVFSRIAFDDGFDQSLERRYTVGLAYRPYDNITFEGDAVVAFGGLSRLVFGTEAVAFNVFALRVGLSSLRSGTRRIMASFGAGVRLGPVGIDYNADLDHGDAFGQTHRVSLGLEL